MASRGVNCCHFVGNLGRDADVRYTNSGACVCNFSIACTEAWTRDGEKQERTEWVNVVIFGTFAETMQQYLLKGTSVYVRGKMRTEKWQDKEGKDRYTTKIYADEVNLVGGRRGGSPAEDEEANRRSTGRQQQKKPDPNPDFDDDIPF